MNNPTATLQLELIAGARRVKQLTPPRNPLVGRSYFDGASRVRVVAACPINPRHVVLERQLDGKRWTAPSGLLRLILGEGPRK